MKKQALGDYRRHVGLRFRAAREAAGYETAREFARELGVEENTMTKWERGDAFPNEIYLRKFKDLTKVPIDFIYTGDLGVVSYSMALKIEALLPPEAVNRQMA